MRWLLVAVALLLAGCKTRLLDARAPDLASDGADAGCGDYRHHHLSPASAESIEPADDEAVIGRAVRVRVGVLLGGCDLLGAIDVQVIARDEQPDEVVLSPHVWLADDPTGCAPFAKLIRVVDIGDAGLSERAGPILVKDATPDGSVHLSLATRIAPHGCKPVPPGGSCERDCQCDAARGERCVEAGGQRAVCATPCNEDADCAVAGIANCGFAPPATCGPNTKCASDESCPFGQRCVAGGCRPAQLAVAGAPCGCDAACGFGGICKLGIDPGFCALPCATDADCLPTAACRESECRPRQ